MSLSIPFPFGWLLNKKTARVEVNISLAFLHWVGIAVPWPFLWYSHICAEMERHTPTNLFIVWPKRTRAASHATPW